MKKLLCVLVVLCVVAIEHALGKCDPNTDCSTLTYSFSTLSNTCCKQKLNGDLFKVSDIPKSCSQTSAKVKWANSYQISSLQDIYYYNYIDILQTDVSNALCTNGEFLECIFKANNLLSTSGSGNINVTALKKNVLLNLQPDAVWKGIFDKILDPFDKTLKDSPYKFEKILNDRYNSITCDGKQINLQPLMITQLIQSKINWMCPERYPVWLKVTCGNLMEDYKFCDGEKIFSPTGQGVFYYP